MLLGIVALLTGSCRKDSRDGAGGKAPKTAAVAGEAAPRIFPVTNGNGTVVKVADELRFVILEFFLQSPPEPGQLLFLYRQGQKMARVRVTGPTYGQTTAADILEGNAQAGDEVWIE